MNKKLSVLVLGVAVFGMGAGMPSCPGQQAMQLQIDGVQATNTELTKKVQTLTTQVGKLNSDSGQIKQLLTEMTNVISSQRECSTNSLLTYNSFKREKAKRRNKRMFKSPAF